MQTLENKEFAIHFRREPKAGLEPATYSLRINHPLQPYMFHNQSIKIQYIKDKDTHKIRACPFTGGKVTRQNGESRPSCVKQN